MLSLISLWHHFASACWAPWVFLAAERAFVVRRWKAVAVWAFASGLQILAGSADVVAMTLIGLAVHTALVRVRWKTPLAARNRRLLGLGAAAVALAIGLAAVQIGAALDVLRTSPRRQQNAYTRTYWSVNPIMLADAFTPMVLKDLPLDEDVRRFLLESREPFLGTLYLGVGTLPLAGAALLRSRPHRRALALALIVAGAGLVSLGRFAPFYALLMTIAPPLRILRYPVKAWILLAFAWGLLCAHGVDVWRSPRAPSRRTWTAAVLLPTLLAGAALLGMAAVVWRDPRAVLNLLLDPLVPLHEAIELFKPLAGRLLLASTFAGAAVALGVLRARRPHLGRPLALAIALLAVADLAVVLRNLDTGVSRLLYARPPVVDFLRQAHADRIYVYDYFSDPMRGLTHHGGSFTLLSLPLGWTEDQGHALNQELHLAYTLPARWGLSSGYERDWHNLAPPDLAHMVLLVPQLENTPLHLRLLRMAGITHVVSLHSGPYGDLKLVARLPSLYAQPILVFEVPRPLPRAYVVAGAQPAEGMALFAAVLNSTFDPEREVALSGGRVEAAPALAAGAAGTAVVTERRADRLVVQADATTAGYLVLLEGHDPAWRAEVDGRSAPVLRANIAFLAVPLSPGRHVVRLEYRPPGAALGLAVSVASLAGCLLLMRARS